MSDCVVNRLTLPLADWVGSVSLGQASDAQLLHRFAKAGEQQAFAVLVKRHGPLVWGVARRLLRDHQDAEDAFQAAFLVLARKADSLRQPQLLASWLHGVSHRTALQLRSRTKHLVPLDDDHEPFVELPDSAAWRDCRLVIDRSIEQLPASLRIVFLLCQAEGLTTLAASKRLNLPEGTVVSRLHRARRQLQNLLTRHGITSAAGAITAAWCLTLPETLSAFTVRTVLGSTPPALVAGLAQGVLTTMMWIKVTTAAVLVSTVGLVGAGAATVYTQGTASKSGTSPAATQAQSRDDRIRQLEAQLAEARDREEHARRQLAEMEKRAKAIQAFLEKSVLAETDQKNKATQEAALRETMERAAREAADRSAREAALMMEKTRKLEVDKAEKRLQEKMIAQDRRQHDLMKAKAQLVMEIEKLQMAYSDLERLQLKSLSEQQLHEKKQQDLEAQILRLEQLTGSVEREQVKNLMAQRDQLIEVRRNMHHSRSEVMSMTRLQSQMKLREKLLIEVEEKMLRAQLKLDE